MLYIYIYFFFLFFISLSYVSFSFLFVLLYLTYKFNILSKLFEISTLFYNCFKHYRFYIKPITKATAEKKEVFEKHIKAKIKLYDSSL